MTSVGHCRIIVKIDTHEFQSDIILHSANLLCNFNEIRVTNRIFGYPHNQIF
ncbi:hypothetical protein Pint_17841 [Pistacia integerrima]|uniref:Uncharacterized protein n=1 Tax=Pistacia integerrima TaxID=434235 RepID=A0ACC0YXL0_9ROSI|nr:hypothetical protein Pint_17841 [Pistacia integerrima]